MNARFTLATIYLVAFAGYTSISWLFPVIPYYTTSLGISVADTGFIVSLYSYVLAIGIIPVGMLSDRLGRRQFLVAGLILSTIAPCLYPLAQDIASLYLVGITLGLGGALFMPTALATITDLSRQGEHGKAIGWYTAASQLGLMAGPVAGGYIVQQFGFSAAFYGCGALPLIALIFVLTRLRAIPQKPVTRSTGEHPWLWLRHPGAIVSLLALVITAVASSTVSTFIPLYVRDFGISAAGAGMIITACYASSAALRIPSGALADRLGNAPMIIAGIFLSAIAIALIPSFHVLWPLAAVGLMYGLGMGLSMPASLSWLANLSPVDKRGFSMGLGSAAFQVGLAVGATVMGIVVQNSGFSSMYLTTAGAVAVSGIIMILLLLTFKRPDK
ncbi:MAG: MFS transporter [Chloroflexi bacterium]|nr:MFS transporter [Chloroflexota bacterium]